LSSILFIEDRLRADKLGIMYLSRVLKDDGHEVNLVINSEEDVLKYLSKKKVDYVMYSVMSGSHRWFKEINKKIKNKFDVVSVAGGPHYTFFSEDAEFDDDIDFCVIGPGEDVILDIVNKKVKNKIIQGHINPNIDDIKSPDRDLIYKYDRFGKSKMKRFIAGRDCPNSCSFCFNHLYHRMFIKERNKFFQITSVEKIMNEIIEVKKKYGLELAFFNDDDLAVNKNWLLDLCKELRKKEILFGGSVRANNVNEDIIKIMADSGCYFLHMSLESAMPETQKILRRGNINNDQIKKACEFSEKFGIKVRLQNMLGLPVEDPLEDALATFDFNKNLNITDSWASIFQPFPKTDIYKYCVEKGFLDEGVECMNFYEDSVLNIKNKDEIHTLHKLWYFAVKNKFPSELIKILIKQKLNKKIKKEIQEYRWKLISEEYYNI
jgi:anaerobic magnesium-protoporphyrin IX monomethyl ester cyclase